MEEAPDWVGRGQVQDDRLATAGRELLEDAAHATSLGATPTAALADVDGFPPAVMTIEAGPLRVRDQVEDWARTWGRKAGRPKKSSESSE